MSDEATPPVAPVEASRKPSADELRSLLVANYEKFKPTLELYYEYAKIASAIAVEYHEARFRESIPAASIEEFTLITTCDSRETPASLDRKLIELRDAGVTIRKIIFDRARATYYLFT